MPFERFMPHGPRDARGVVIFLPGLSDGPDDYVKYGFPEILRELAPGYDAIAPNAHIRYYRKRTVFARLEEDVIGPLRAQGYAASVDTSNPAINRHFKTGH